VKIGSLNNFCALGKGINLDSDKEHEIDIQSIAPDTYFFIAKSKNTSYVSLVL